MALPTPKELKSLAAACRAAGIKHFKSGEIEFTLSDEAPISKPRGKAAQKLAAQAKVNHDDGKAIDTKEATPSEEDLLFWSAMGGMPVPIALPGSET